MKTLKDFTPEIQAKIPEYQKMALAGVFDGGCYKAFNWDDAYAAVGSDGATLQHIHESKFNGDYATKKIIEKADHRPLTLEPGIYEFFIQGAYNPL